MVVKKALLIKPKDDYSYAVVPNLGLGYLASSLRRGGFQAEILDCNREEFNQNEFAAYLRHDDFHLIGFQVYTNSLLNTQGMMKTVNAALPNSIIIIGGPHPSGDPEHALRFFREADCAVVGEGEEAICELMKLSKTEMRDGFKLASVKNIAFTDKSDTLAMNANSFIEDLDQLPFPAWDLIDPKKYSVSPHGTFSRAYPVAPIITSRGCPYPCTFCAGYRTTGKKIRKRSITNVLDEIQFLYAEYGVREFHIEDDNFTLQKSYVLEFVKGIRDRGLKFSWACPNGIRADRLDEEMLLGMERSGCYSFGLGIESGSDRILTMMKKEITVEEIEQKVSLIKRKTKIDITGFFLIGYPGETEEDIQETLSFSRRLLIDKASFSPVMPLPGSELYLEWKKRVNTHNLDWGKFLYYQFIPFVSDIEEKRLKAYLREALLKFYLRPRIILGLLLQIKTWHQLKVILNRAKTVLFGS